MLRASWSLTSAHNPSPALVEVQLEAAGPVTGGTGPWALGKGVPGLGGGCPRLPPSLERCACPIPQQISLPVRAAQAGKLPCGCKPNSAQIGDALAPGLAVG